MRDSQGQGQGQRTFQGTKLTDLVVRDSSFPNEERDAEMKSHRHNLSISLVV